MNIVESYVLLLTDSIFGNIILYPADEFILFFMKDIGSYNPYKIYLTASIGFFIAIFINYILGIILKKIYFACTEKEQRHNYNSLTLFFRKFGSLVILLHLAPSFGSIIIVLSGFAKYSFKVTFIVALLSKMLYYGLYFIL